MSRRSKREAKALRRERERLAASAERAEHLKREQFNDKSQYQNWWKNMKQVTHEEMVEVPWAWSVTTLNPITGKREETKGKPVQDKKEGENTANPSLYAQGGELFLLKDGRTQKLTAMHKIELTGADGKKVTSFPAQVAQWSEEEENLNRAQEAKTKARG